MASDRRHSRPAISWIAVCVAVAVLSACGGIDRPRHLVIITLDTMRADRLPPYGFAGVATPALDRLAVDGVVFEAAFAPVPLTLPSHTALFTGLYPQATGVRDNAGAPLAPEFTTLAERMHAAGATTAAFVASGVLAADRGLEQGFTVYDDPARACGGSPRARRRADEVVDAAMTWISRAAPAPFFLWVHLFDTHRPYDLPPDYARPYADPYLAAIAFEDAQIARLIDHLERRDLLDDTLIVIAGDHGESLGDHAEDAHGIFLYQETLHVPLIVRGRGIRPRRVPAVARLVDVTPTVLALLGLPVPPSDGVSLEGLVTSSAPDPALEVYAESTYPERFGWSGLRSLRADRYKVIAAPRPELYDLAVDPHEQRNVFHERPTVAAAMLARLDRFQAASQAADETRVTVPSVPDQALVDRLAALGYAGRAGLPLPRAAGGLPDPKDHIATFNAITSQHWLETAGRPARPVPCRHP